MRRNPRRRPGEVIGALRRSMGAFATRHGIKRVGPGGKVEMGWRFTASDTAYLGLIITAVVTGLTYFNVGLIDYFEAGTYDLRMRHAQWGRAAPTDKLVHLDLDDQSIKDIGRWPWSRATQGELLHEIGMAKPKAVGLDILYSEPEKDEIVEVVPDTKYKKVKNDALFEGALKEAGNVIVTYAHQDSAPAKKSEGFEKMVAALKRNPEISEGQLAAAMSGESGHVRDVFYPARQEAIEQAVRERVERGETEKAVLSGLMGKAFSETDAVVANSPVRRLIEEAYERETRREALLPYRLTAKAEVTKRLDDREPDLLPIEPIAKAAAMTAFVTYNKEGDGTMRRVPLVMNLAGEPAMSLGLAMACEMLEVPLKEVRVEADRVVIPAKAGTIEIPTRTVKFGALSRETAGAFDLPWFGTAGVNTWQTMYDRPGEAHTVSMSEVQQAIDARRRIATNNEKLRETFLALGANAEMESRKYDPEDPQAWTKDVKDQLDFLQGDLEKWKAAPPKDSATDEAAHRDFLTYRAAVSAAALSEEMPKLAEQLSSARAELARKLGGRAVLIGWTATGRTDFVATPLHPACAGVRIHGVVLNAILTGQFIRFAPMPLTLVVTALMGLLCTWAAMGSSPWKASAVAIGLTLGYTAAAVAVFGPWQYVLALAGPLSAIVLTWGGCSLLRYYIEYTERREIRRRFTNYVDPQLVNYLQNHPEALGLAGERRVMTVCFTDLAGFTSVSEKLGEEVVGLLNEYFAVMVPLIRKHRGYLNKFLGDGIMFFFNAPEPNERHAAAAFEAVLEMQAALKEFNAQLVARGLPTVKMRVGITTGMMIAGDAGGGGAFDYTVLGDVVNLSSRLEGANKASGTLILCNRDACEHAGAEFLTRPVGTLKVVGKTQGIETYEVMGKMADVSGEMRQMAKLTERMVEAYRGGNMAECQSWAEQLRETGDGSKLAGMYLGLTRVAHADGFDGSITLESK